MHHRDAMKSHPMTSFPESIPFLARCIWIRRASSKPQTPRFRRGERVYERKLRTGFNARVLRGRPRAHTDADILEYAWSETRTRTHTHTHTRGSRISNWISFASAKLSIDLRCLFSSTSFVLPLGRNDREEEIWC